MYMYTFTRSCKCASSAYSATDSKLNYKTYFTFTCNKKNRKHIRHTGSFILNFINKNMENYLGTLF